MADLRGYVTAAGQRFEALAKQMNYPVIIGMIEIGDGVLPDSESPITRTQLVNKIWSFPASVEQDAKNPGQWVAWIHIPPDHAINGEGYMIREMGCKLIDQGGGILYAYRRVSNDWKPVDTSGEAKSFIYKLRFIPGNGELLKPTIDPSVVLIDREDLDREMKKHKESRDHPAGTKTDQGMLRLATDAEAPAGVKDDVAVTPKQMMGAINAHYLAAGSQLPAKNIGPIWHDDYASWMTWQEFTSNGANYRGYASQNIGSLLLDTQPTPRSGYIKSGVQNLSRATYASLRAWAMHNGIMVAHGVWSAGAIQCADNADGVTFRAYDVRSEFFRAWDDGRGVDAGRAVLSAQTDEFESHTHSPLSVCVASTAPAGNTNHGVSPTYATFNTKANVQTTLAGGIETRPRNAALPANIKF